MWRFAVLFLLAGLLAQVTAVTPPDVTLDGILAGSRDVTLHMQNMRLFTLAMLAKHYEHIVAPNDVTRCTTLSYPSVRVVNESATRLDVAMLATAHDFNTKRSMVVADTFSLSLGTPHRSTPDFDFTRNATLHNYGSDVRQLRLSDGSLLVCYSLPVATRTGFFFEILDVGATQRPIELKIVDPLTNTVKERTTREKNWSPIELLHGDMKRGVTSPLHFVYSLAPLVVLECDRASGLCRVVANSATTLELDKPAASLLRGATPFEHLGFGYYMAFSQAVYVPSDRKSRLRTVLHGSGKNGLRRPVAVVIRANHAIFDYRLLYVSAPLDLPRALFVERNLLPHVQTCTGTLAAETAANVERESLVLDAVNFQLLRHNDSDTALLSLSIQDATLKRSRGLVVVFGGIKSFFEELRMRDSLRRLEVPQTLDFVRHAMDVAANQLKAVTVVGTTQLKLYNVISFSLVYGGESAAVSGMLFNAMLARDVYPDWHVRVYVDSRLHDVEYNELWLILGKLGVEVVWMEMPQRQDSDGHLWRFLVADDPTCANFIVRDATARLSTRERFAVDEWLVSKHIAHVMRDGVRHAMPIEAGTWGGRGNGALGLNMARAIAAWTQHAVPVNATWQSDATHFLYGQVWPLVARDTLVHDASGCEGGDVTCHAFPNDVKTPYYVGEHFTATSTLTDCFLARNTCRLLDNTDAFEMARRRVSELK